MGIFMAKRRVFTFVFVILTLTSFFIAYLSGKVFPLIRTKAEAELNNRLTAALDAALADIDDTSDIISCAANAPDGICSFSVNAAKLAKLRSTLSDSVRNKLISDTSHPMRISLGSLSGIPFFYGRGAHVNIKFSSLYSVSCDTESEFLSAGINQTLHRIVLTLKVTSGLAEPGLSERLDAETSVILCETLVAGKVPGAYTSITRSGGGISEDEFDVRAYGAS